MCFFPYSSLVGVLILVVVQQAMQESISLRKDQDGILSIFDSRNLHWRHHDEAFCVQRCFAMGPKIFPTRFDHIMLLWRIQLSLTTPNAGSNHCFEFYFGLERKISVATYARTNHTCVRFDHGVVGGIDITEKSEDVIPSIFDSRNLHWRQHQEALCVLMCYAMGPKKLPGVATRGL